MLGRAERDERFVDEARMEPLNLSELASLTPDGIDVALGDDRVDTVDSEAPQGRFAWERDQDRAKASSGSMSWSSAALRAPM